MAERQPDGVGVSSREEPRACIGRMRIHQIQVRAGGIQIGQRGTSRGCNERVARGGRRGRRRPKAARLKKIPVHPLRSAAKLKIQLPREAMAVYKLPDIGIERSAALSGEMEVLICV